VAQNRLPVPSEDALVKNCRSRLKKSCFKLGTPPNCCASSRAACQAAINSRKTENCTIFGANEVRIELEIVKKHRLPTDSQ